MAAYTTNYNEVDVNGNTIYYYVSGYIGNYYAYVTYATSSYNSYSGNVVIPQTVTTNDKTYTVKYIDDAAFKNSTGLISVTFPSSIIQVSKNAFEGCSGLTSINLWETSVTSIGNYVFKGCTSLESITIPATTTSLGTNVFEGCISLETITIPSLVTSIGSCTFDGCTSLTTVTINSNLTSIPTYLFRGCTSLSSVNIPSTVTSISGSAFYNCSALTSINIPSGVTSIGYQAFYGCTSLANVTYNATSCGDFSGAVFNASTADLFTVTMGDNVTRLPNNVFSGLTHLESITIPSSVTSIGNNAFNNCSGLASITIPSSVTSIGNTAFYGCSSLSSITIPASVTSIGTNAFQNCTGLTEINYNVITHDDFTESNRPFKGCATNDITVTIGFGVEKIPAYLFYGTKAVGSVTIPGSVNNIGIKSFANTGGNYTSLTTVYMMGTTAPELADATIFKSGYSSYCTIKVFYSGNHSILTNYQEAEYWSTFSSNISETNNFTVTNMDLTGITTPVTIPSGNTITVTGTATNPTAANLVIADGGQLICNNSVAATVKKSTTASEAKTSNAWYAISSPINGAVVSEFAQGTHNVYRYDEPTFYWQEYHNWGSTPATLANGRGYLYRSTMANIEFTGNTNVSDVNCTVTYTPKDNPLPGFNLIGNPFTHEITWSNLTTTKIADAGYYLLGTNGEWASQTTEGTIAPMQGFLIQAIGENPAVTISKAAAKGENANHDNIMFKVENSEYSDISYAMFDKGYGLSKINHRNAEIPMLYIIDNGENFAVADMPDNTSVINIGFEAKTIGQYTFSLKAEGQYSYMHLFDKLTGEDVDMLVEDSYSFIGAPNDRKDRFVLRLNYNAGSSTGSETEVFAYQSGNDIIVSGEGELQVFDVTGRMVMRQNINGVQTVNGLNNGVYIFKLEGKTQKIVVR